MSHKLKFRVVHATSQDDGHGVAELGRHGPGCRGWKSSNFCIYPQNIVISLDNRCQIKKIQILSHQFLIATKIEFFVGDCPSKADISLNTARFTRLGYVSLSDNERTQFKARELKSVHVDAVGRFVKLIVHKNFINKHNLYNQVGIIAVNVLGHELATFDLDELDQINSNIVRQDYIAPTEDLAFDMCIDPETAQIIRKLEKQKQEAVENEEFDKAKKIRDSITYLQEVGEKLGKLEIEKRNAIENENYDRAKMKKQQIDQYRYNVYRELDLNALLNEVITKPKIKEMKEEVFEKYVSPRMNQNNNALVFEDPKSNNYEERPLPALQNKNQLPEMASARKIEPVEEIKDNTDPTNSNQAEVVEVDEGVIPGMTKSDLSEASDAIDVYGLPLVSRLYSKNWSHREDGLLEIMKRLSDLPSESDKEDVKAELRAATCVLKKAFKNRVTQVIQVAINMNKLIMTELVEKLGIIKPEIHYYLDKIVPEIFKCTEDKKVQIKELTFPHLIEMSQWDQVKQFPHIFSDSIKPFAPTTLNRSGVIKSELLLELYSIHGLCNNHFSLDSFMKYATEALKHRSNEVRDSVMTLLVVLYRNEDRGVVRSYLPPDDMHTRKNILYKNLFEKFDKIDGITEGFNNPPPIQERARPAEKVQKMNEIKSKQNQLKLQSPAVVKAPPKTTPRQQPQSSRNNYKSKPSQYTSSPTQAQAAPQIHQVEMQEDLLADLDKTCIFCGEKNDDFKVNMDLHYWKHCPILRRCPYCKQAVEISSLTQHLLQECDQTTLFDQCNRCSEAILKSDLEQHVADGLCNPTEPNSLRCPLCHENLALGPYIDSPESLWQFHLMDETNGCPQNPRRLVALQRKKQPHEVTNKAPGNKPATNNKKSQLPRAKGK